MMLSWLVMLRRLVMLWDRNMHDRNMHIRNVDVGDVDIRNVDVRNMNVRNMDIWDVNWRNVDVGHMHRWNMDLVVADFFPLSPQLQQPPQGSPPLFLSSSSQQHCSGHSGTLRSSEQQALQGCPHCSGHSESQSSSG